MNHGRHGKKLKTAKAEATSKAKGKSKSGSGLTGIKGIERIEAEAEAVDSERKKQKRTAE